jgi:hypothetical protein
MANVAHTKATGKPLGLVKAVKGDYHWGREVVEGFHPFTFSPPVTGATDCAHIQDDPSQSVYCLDFRLGPSADCLGSS